jgi:hypothetical protein
LTPEQEHFWKVLKFDAKTMAIELGTIMEDAKVKYGSNSKKFHAAADRCFFLVMNQAQTDMDVVRIVKHWLSVMHLPLDPSKLASTDYFHNRYGKLILDLVDNRQSMDWN